MDEEYSQANILAERVRATWRNSQPLKADGTHSSPPEKPWLLNSGDVKSISGMTVITMVHPGYFAYNAAYQRLLYPIYLLQVELFYTSKRAQARGIIMTDVESNGLWAALQTAKQDCHGLISAITTLRNQRRGWTHEEQVQMDNARSKQAIKRRRTVLDRQIDAVGAAHSLERRSQLHQILVNAPQVHSLEAKDVKAGSEEWWEILMGCKEGRSFVLLLDRAPAAMRTTLTCLRVHRNASWIEL